MMFAGAITEKQNHPLRETVIYKLRPSEVHNFFSDIPNIIQKNAQLTTHLFLK